MLNPDYRPLAPGAGLLRLPDERFKTMRLTAALLLPLREETASGYALLPFLLRRSCADYPDFTALKRRLNELYGARVSAEVQRIGEAQALVLSAVSIDDRFALHDEEIGAECAFLLRSMLFSPALTDGRFSGDAVALEKRCLTELIQSEINEKRLYARRRCEQLLCRGEGYAVDRYGTLDGVNVLTPDSMTAAWNDALSLAQVRLILQGAADDARVADAFRAGFDSLPARTPVPCDTDVVRRAREVREETERMDVGQAKLVLGFRAGVAAPDPELPAMRLMNALLGGSPQSLLFRNVREKLSLCYYCASSYDRLKGILLIDSGVEETAAPRAREEILRQLEAIRTGNFTDEDLEAARLSLQNQFLTVGDLPSSQAAWYLSQTPGAVVSPEQAAAEVAAATREQVIDAARRVTPGAAFLLAGTRSA